MKNEQKLAGLMRELGHDELTCGTRYLRSAIAAYEPGMSLTKELYPGVARAVNSTPQRVERCMRHSLEKAWNRGDPDAQLKYFGYSISPETGRPRVGEYVARMAQICREELEY